MWTVWMIVIWIDYLYLLFQLLVHILIWLLNNLLFNLSLINIFIILLLIFISFHFNIILKCPLWRLQIYLTNLIILEKYISFNFNLSLLRMEWFMIKILVWFFFQLNICWLESLLDIIIIISIAFFRCHY